MDRLIDVYLLISDALGVYIVCIFIQLFSFIYLFYLLFYFIYLFLLFMFIYISEPGTFWINLGEWYAKFVRTCIIYR